MTIFNKIIHRLGLSKWIYKMKSRKERCANNPCLLTVNEALNFLHKVSPDVGHSCVIDRVLPILDCDLEVIVPCYNVEKYVEECVDSILAQKTKYSFFVTIVNDGAKDHTREILQKYEKLSNVKIIDQENKGLSGARNTGIRQAHGCYLLFVDSDDVLLPGAIEELMSLAIDNNADVVDSGHIRFADRTRKGLRTKIMADIYDALQRPQTLSLNLSSSGITGYPWGKIFKTELFNKVHFPQGYWFEDTLVWMILEPLCKRKVTSNKLTCRYRMNPNSITHLAMQNTKSLDTLYITLKLLNDREILGIEFDQYQYDLLLQQMRNNFCRIASLDSKTKQAVFVVQQDLIVNKFATWSTINPKVKPIEDFLRVGDYEGFELWCKWH
ncbi:MAG: glycosyltransferase [Bacteroidales bacterium]|nr:glycosyltransferase [Bacteroidales bacterium]